MNRSKFDRFRDLATEQLRRKSEALNLYRPMPNQEPFHRSDARIKIVRGGTRSGKSTSVATEFARAVTGQDPYKKYPTDRPLLAYIVGYDGDHIGRAIFRLLFKPGLFWTIKDNGVWRAFDPAIDTGREDEVWPSQPLIPPRLIDPKGWAWEHKAERIFSVCRLNFGEGHPMTGTEIRAFGSRSKPAQGDPVDIIWIDEDLYDDGWIKEMKSRISDKTNGHLMWSAFPKGTNDALYDMSNQCEELRREGATFIEEFVLAYSDNLHIPEQKKTETVMLLTPEERKARDYGEFQLESTLMYPTFNVGTHGLLNQKIKTPFEIMCEEQVCKFGELPRDWCRYAFIDPGHAVCAVIGLVIPPPSIADVVIAEWELYLRQCDAMTFAKNMSDKIGNRVYEAFIIDEHGSRVTQAGSGVSIKVQYSEALATHGVSCRATGNWFISGSDDVHGRCMKFREWLAIRNDGSTKFRIIHDRLPYTRQEFAKYRKRIVGADVDMPVQKNNHSMDCLGYAAAYNPQFVKHEVSPSHRNPVLAEFQRWQEAERKQGSGDSINFGPPSGVAA